MKMAPRVTFASRRLTRSDSPGRIGLPSRFGWSEFLVSYQRRRLSVPIESTERRSHGFTAMPLDIVAGGSACVMDLPIWPQTPTRSRNGKTDIERGRVIRSRSGPP